VVFESLGQALDFSTRDPSGEILFRLPAIGAFSFLALALLVVALAGKRPDAEETKADTAGEI
jgi:hypothetical protein